MRKEYDFSTAWRGRFCRPGGKLNFPFGLEAEFHARLASAARKRGEGIDMLVNRLSKGETKLAEH